MTTVTPEQMEKLSELVAAATTALTAAQKYADDTNQKFMFGPDYGMGGTYYGKNYEGDAWESSSVGWVSSSSQC